MLGYDNEAILKIEQGKFNIFLQNLSNNLNNKTMEQYLGVKLVNAELARGYNNKLYTAASPAGVETQDGYKVVYEDGYTSWSPKDVFEKAYRNIKNLGNLSKPCNFEVDSYKWRTLNEAKELEFKIDKLELFIKNDITYCQLTKEEQDRLIQQFRAMQYYLTILIERIENF